MTVNTVRYSFFDSQTVQCAAHRVAAVFCFIPLFFVLLFSILPSQVAAQSAAGCPDGLVHYFGFDESESGKYEDYVSGKTATCTACPSPGPGRFAGAQRFNGSNAGLTLSDVDQFEWGPNSSFTIEVWVQVAANTSNNQVIVGRASKNTTMSWWLGVNTDGYVVLDMRDNAGGSHVVTDYLKVAKVNDGKWHHIAVVRDGTEERTKLYVDGLRVDDLRDDRKEYRGSFESTSPLTIGYLDLGNMFRLSGSIDELRVYSRNLSEQEMRARYSNGAGNYCGPRPFAPEIVSNPITFGTVGQQYTYDVNASGNPDPQYILTVAPQGMTINASTGLISWVPQAGGNFTVEVKATNSQGESAPQRFQVAVQAATKEGIGMLHHWPLNESSGNRFRDIYTPIDAVVDVKKRPAAVKGAVGGAQRFNGTDTGLDVYGSPNFDWEANQNFTIELWLRTETRDGSSEANNQVLIGRYAKDSPSQWWLGLDKDRRAAFYLPDISFQGPYIGNAGPKLNDGSWHQMVVTRDGGGNIRLYVDGQEITTGRFANANSFISRSPVNIGYFNASVLTSYPYEGDLDEVKLFGRVLTPEEIRERYTDVYNGLTEFLSFTGRYADGESFSQKIVVLDWRTANEIESAYFDVERSEDGENFVSVGQVQASGTTTATVEYTFTDQTPLKEKGYYRLKLMKQDGSFIYSQTILVQDRSPLASAFRVYPNPAARGTEVSIEIFNLKENENVTFTITDPIGRVVLELQERTNEMGELYLKLPVDMAFRPGIYNLTVRDGNKMLNRKLVVAQ